MRPLRLVWLVGMLLLVIVILQPETLFARTTAAPGDENWQDQFYLGGPDGGVTTLAKYGSDFYAGGGFDTAGNALADHIAKWNGSVWNGAGNPTLEGICTYHCGLGKQLEINASLVETDTLYVGGTFTHGILQWDGSQWSYVGGGLDGPTDSGDPECYSSVNALAVMQGDLIAGGCFNQPSTFNLANLLRWDGSNWTELNGEMAGGPVEALAVNGDDMYAGGSFATAGGVTVDHIAKWNRISNTWTAVGSGFPGYSVISAMQYFQGNLIVATWGFDSDATISTNLLSWDGAQWTVLAQDSNAQYETLQIHNNELYVAGRFASFNSQSISNLAIWNGTTWRGLPHQLDTGFIQSLLFDGSDLYVGGQFDEVQGIQAINTAKWDGSNWSALLTPGAQGVVGNVNTVVARGTDVYVGGSFDWVGTTHANGLARWDTLSQAWTPLGNAACESSACRAKINAITFDGTKIYVGGAFSEIGGVPATNIAVWNGSQWKSVGTAHTCCINAIAVKNGSVYVGGTSTRIGGILATIDQWDGKTWNILGKLAPRYSPLYALTFYKNNLYAGGYFQFVDNQPISNLAQWDGAAWSSVGTGVPSQVQGFASHGSKLIIATTNGVYQWNGSTVRKVGADSDNVIDVTMSDGTLYRSGDATDFDTTSRGIAVWNSPQWQTLGSGIALNPNAGNQYGGTASGIAVVGHQVYIGGVFSIVGGKPSHNFGEWLNPAPFRPALTAPANNRQLDSTNPRLRWAAATGATLYQIQVRVNKRNGNLILDTTTSTTNVQLQNLKRGKTYFWRVRACNGADCSAWTGYWSFTIKP